MIRKFLYALGALTLIVIVVAGVGLGVLAYKGSVLDAESKDFVDAAVPAIVGSWSKEQLLERATPELRENARPDDLRALFDAFSRLGSLVEYEGAKGDANMSYMTGTGSVVSASYVAKARFQNGDAVFRIVLLKRDGHWMIHNFRVDPAPGNRDVKST